MMKTPLKYKNAVVLITLLCSTLGCAALTLGRAQGLALVGRPFELTVNVQLDGGEAIDPSCLEAEVFYADTLQNPGRVRVTAEGGGQPQARRLRIISEVPVDEPVVTVYLRTLCGQKISRHYVLLAELVDDLAMPTVQPPQLGSSPEASTSPSPTNRKSAGVARSQTAAQSSSIARSQTVAQSSAPASSGSAVAPEGAVSRPKHKLRDASQPAPAAHQHQAATQVRSGMPIDSKAQPVMRSPPGPVAGRPRLQLDLLDLFELPDSTLMISSELLTRPSENPQRRLEAIAMWRAVNASPQEILHAADRVLDLQADVRALKTITANNQSGLTDLEARLQKVQSERYANPVVYLLAGLLMASLLALLLLWRRRAVSDEPDWWRAASFDGEGPETALPPEASEGGKSDGSDAAQASKSNPDDALAAPNPDLDIDISMPDVVVGKAPKKPFGRA